MYYCLVGLSNVLQAVHADQRILPVTCHFLLLGRLFLHPVVLASRTPSTCVLQMYFLQRRKKRSHSVDVYIAIHVFKQSIHPVYIRHHLTDN